VDDEARRLVEDEEVTVLVEHAEREILRLGDCRLGRWNGDLHPLAALEALRRTPGTSVDENPSCFQERLHAGAAELGEAEGDGAIEPLPAQRRSDGEPVDFFPGAVAL